MNNDTDLHRILQSNHVKNGEIRNESFRVAQDEEGLSVYDGTDTTPQEAFQHRIDSGFPPPAGIITFQVKDCAKLGITVKPDPLEPPKSKIPFPQHTLLIPPPELDHADRNRLFAKLLNQTKDQITYRNPKYLPESQSVPIKD